MSETSPPVVPPTPLSGGPNEPEPARRPLFAAFVFIFLLAIVLGVLAVVSLLQDPDGAADLAGGPVASSSLTPPGTPSPPQAFRPRRRRRRARGRRSTVRSGSGNGSAAA